MSDRQQFQRVEYSDLNGKQKEIFNFQKVAATLADYGFNCIKLADDWQGADFLAYHFKGETTLKVQLKARIYVDKKYCDKDIWLAFPHDGFWYLIKHDELCTKVGEHTDWHKSRSWIEKGSYNSVSINPGLLDSLKEFKLGEVYGRVLPEDGD